MVFGASDAIKRDLRACLPLHDMIRGMKMPQARKALDERGISSFQVDMILDAVQLANRTVYEKANNWHYRLVEEPDPYWPKDHIQAVKTLIGKKLVTTDGGNTCYYLTPTGEQLRVHLMWCRTSENYKKSSSRDLPATVESRTDISLHRDGLLTTASKILWCLMNRGQIVAARANKAIQEYLEGQKQIEATLKSIQALDSKVYVAPLIKEEPYWTEEDQRAQNDQYWLSGGSAFWLNPNVYRNGGFDLLAEHCPAPDWWSPPAIEQKTIVDDLVERSLLPPPIMPKSKEEILDEIILDISKLGGDSPDHYEEDYDEWASRINAEEEKTTNKNSNKVNSADLYIVEANNMIQGFSTKAEAEEFKRLIHLKAKEKQLAITKAKSTAKLPCGCPLKTTIRQRSTSDGGRYSSCHKCGATWEPPSNDLSGRRLAQGETVKHKRPVR